MSAAELFVKVGDKTVQAQGGVVKKNFFEFFRLPLVEGNREQLLADDNSIVLTRSAAIRLFGTEHAIGKTLTVIPCNNATFTVTGITEDFDNSILSPDIEMYMPFENMKYINWSSSIECTGMNYAGPESEIGRYSIVLERVFLALSRFRCIERSQLHSLVRFLFLRNITGHTDEPV